MIMPIYDFHTFGSTTNSDAGCDENNIEKRQTSISLPEQLILILTKCKKSITKWNGMI